MRLAAFAFAKFEFRGKQILFWLMMLTMMLPVYATLIPSFYLFSRILNWVNTYKVLDHSRRGGCLRHFSAHPVYEGYSVRTARCGAH